MASSQSLTQKKADRLYSRLSYIEAIDYYKSLAGSDAPAEANLRRLAECYFRVYDFKNAEPAYKRLIDRYGNTATEADLINYLQCLKYNRHYAEAQPVLASLDQKRKGNLIAASHTKHKDYERALKKDSGAYRITPVESLNTEESEFSPVFFHHNRSILFASNRRNVAARNKTFSWDNSYFIDMYTAEKTDSLKFHSAIPMVKQVSGLYHDGPAALSPDERTLYLTKSNVVTKKIKGLTVQVVNLKLYIIRKDSLGRLSEPESFPYNSDDYSLGHAALTKDGKRLYFISDMPGGYGQTDLYVSEWKDGSWQKPENLGQGINTEGREMFPYVHEDGTLFFSTDGRAGLGGLDLYFSAPGLDAYFEPQNLGYPLNSNDDDFGFALNADLKTGYFSSNRPGGKGRDDIYFFRSKEPLLGTELRGIVFDENSKELVANAKVYLMDTHKAVIDSATVNAKGEYAFVIQDPSQHYFIGAKEPGRYYDRLLPLGKLSAGPNQKDIGLFPKYKLICTVTDARTHLVLDSVKATMTDNIRHETKLYYTDINGIYRDIIRNKKAGDKLSYLIKFEKKGYITVIQEFGIVLDQNTIVNLNEHLTCEMTRMEKGVDIGKTIHLNPIYFDLAKWDIRPDAAIELDKIVKIMQENPSIVIELGSHTDCRAGAAYNMKLSDKRAKASAAYIISKGISKTRIYGKGYGESRLINACKCEGAETESCTEEEHQKNRRTEFVIVRY